MTQSPVLNHIVGAIQQCKAQDKDTPIVIAMTFQETRDYLLEAEVKGQTSSSGNANSLLHKNVTYCSRKLRMYQKASRKQTKK